jgi:MFS family permease
MFIAGIAYGPVGAFLPELFQTRYRYTAAGFSYNIAGVLGGAIPPLVAAAITAAFGGFAFGVFLAAFCLISLVCTLALRETRDDDMDRATARANA